MHDVEVIRNRKIFSPGTGKLTKHVTSYKFNIDHDKWDTPDETDHLKLHSIGDNKNSSMAQVPNEVYREGIKKATIIKGHTPK